MADVDECLNSSPTHDCRQTLGFFVPMLVPHCVWPTGMASAKPTYCDQVQPRKCLSVDAESGLRVKDQPPVEGVT